MNEKTKNMHSWTRKKITLTITAITLFLFILFGSIQAYNHMNYYNNAAELASTAHIRELILRSVRALKKDAPVDPRTGDIYFPESRLFLPDPGLLQPLTYLYDKGNVTDSQGELSISTYPIRGPAAFYNAQNTKDLFAAVPKLQACSRGIKIVTKKFPQTDNQNELKQTVHLSDGGDLYVYIEKDCPELNETTALFKNLQSY
ncbi:MAG: hypothetical protein JWO96_586 [Candidatus Saccharibacteria bacterium]|nr:hypothetical protein [Candidatus Saccharibacteria bacterium]